MKRIAIVSVALLLGTAFAAAQPAPSPNAKPQEPATQPQPGPRSGTAPGNQGSTGWTGGTGGSFTGTSLDGPTPGSKSDQPETVKGINPQPSGGQTTPNR